MNDSPPAPSDDGAYFEQRIFIVSPFGTWTTALILYAVMAASYVGAAALSGTALVPVGHFLSGSYTRLASVLLLILCLSVAMQRFVRLKERTDFDAFALVLTGGAADAAILTSMAPRGVQLLRGSLVGLVAGILLSITFYARNPQTSIAAHLALFIWFAIATTLLAMAFSRGVALTSASTKSMRGIIEHHLVVDLLRIDRLYVWGRVAARVALIWFAVSAAACLLFVTSEITALTIFILVGCAAMGLWVFVATMDLIRRKIRTAKEEELDRLRSEIADLRARIHQDSSVGAKLQGLLAYEARIAAVHEWPFDQTTLVRVGASALILTVPWFGQAAAQYFVEHIARVVG